MAEPYQEAKEERATRLPRHLVGALTNEERYEMASKYYSPLLKAELSKVLKGDPYKTEGVQTLVTKSLEDPDNNTVDGEALRKDALQQYVNTLRSRVEALAVAQYLASKNPALDGSTVTNALEDMQYAREGDMRYADE